MQYLLRTLFSLQTRLSLRTMSSQPATAERVLELVENYQRIDAQVSSAEHGSPVTIVAVSKLKPASDIRALYDHGVRHFGENYVQELIGKAAELPSDIKWHFIGGLQTNKCKDLGGQISNLYAVETIDSLKKCRKLDAARAATEFPNIRVYLQINTSGEEQKSGFTLDLEELHATVKYLLHESKKLTLAGLMTIGSLAESGSDSEVNKDFAALLQMLQMLNKKYSLSLLLSMGMSSDYLLAIKQGSLSVRVGTSIFGARPPRK